MEIHKVKPIHSWRDFLKELGTIVLGICIALAGEQLIEDQHWHNQVEEAHRAIAAEMAQNVGTAIVMARNQLCAERRLNEVAQILDEASKTGVLPPVGQIGRPAPRLWRWGTWDSLMASQVVTHFPRQQLAGLADIYTAIRQAAALQEAEAWTDLSAISGPGRRLDAAAETALRAALSRARFTTQSRAGLSAIILDRTKAQHLAFSQQDLELIGTLRLEAKKVHNGNVPPALARSLPAGFGLCKPMGPVPSHYGQVSLGDAPMTEDRLNALSDFGAP